MILYFMLFIIFLKLIYFIFSCYIYKIKEDFDEKKELQEY